MSAEGHSPGSNFNLSGSGAGRGKRTGRWAGTAPQFDPSRLGQTTYSPALRICPSTVRAYRSSTRPGLGW